VHKGDLARAIADFDQAIPDRAAAGGFFVSRGLAHRARGDLDQALADFSKAIEIDSRFADAFVNRCVAYEDKGEADLAVQDCSAAIALNQRTPSPYNDRGVAYEKGGNVEGALADLEGHRARPRHRDAFANRAVLYDHRGEKSWPSPITGRPWPESERRRPQGH
jgi:tetratricopeptide (TPR) repeat protein